MSNTKDTKNGILVYDLEIVQAIPQRNKAKEPDIVYCAGWEDHANMGVSVIGAYDSLDDGSECSPKRVSLILNNWLTTGF